MRALLIAGLLGWASVVFAQAPDTVWTRYYLNDGLARRSMAAFQVADGNYVVCGYIYDGIPNPTSFGMKLDQSGELMWYHEYRFLEDGLGSCKILRGIPTADGNFVCTGFGSRGTSSSGAYIMKFDLNGDTLWTRIYGQMSCHCYNFYELPEGDLIAGQEDVFEVAPFQYKSAVSVACFSTDGDLRWNRQYLMPDSIPALGNEPVHIVPFHNDHILVTRNFQFPGETYVWLLEIAENGDSLFSTSRSCQPNEQGWGFELVETIRTSNGSILLAGDCGGWNYMAKLNTDLELEWERIYESWVLESPFYDLHPLPDGGACFATETIIPEPHQYATVYGRLDATGDTVWTRTFSPDNPLWLYSGGVIGRTSNGGYIAASDVDLLATPECPIHVILFGPDTNSVSATEAMTDIPARSDLLQAYPNPFNPTTTISFDLDHAGMVRLKVFDITGREVNSLIEESMTAGAHAVSFDGEGLASGIYFYSLQCGNQKLTKKMVLLK
jgi:hypothetical protein